MSKSKLSIVQKPNARWATRYRGRCSCT